MRLQMHIFFISLYLFIGLVPYFGSVDKIAPQWLALSILNTIAAFYFIKDFNFYFKSKSHFINFFKIASVFLFFGLTSFSNTINFNESLVYLFRLVTILLSFFSLFLFIFHTKIKSLFLIPVFLIFFDIIYLFYDLFNVDFHNFFNSRQALKGYTGNINISSFLLLYKLPFVFYALFTSNKRKYFFLCYFLITMSSLFILFNGSRLAIVSLFLLLFSNFLFFILRRSKQSFFSGVIAIFLLLFYLISYNNQSSVSINNRFGSDLINSSNVRLDMILASLEHISHYPLFGSGLGTWKIYSVASSKETMTNYQVPYHVHNDFFEIASEIGIIPGLLYLSIFLILIYFLFKKFKNLKSFFLLSSLLIVFIDSFFNFPFSRPVQLIFILFIFSLITNFLIEKNEIS